MADGNYTVILQDQKGCEAMYSFNITTTGIETTSPKSNIKLYPNPANAKVVVEIGNTNNSDAKIEIIDALGRLQISETTKQPITTIDTDKLKPGLYFVKISHNSTTESRIFVIDKKE